MKKIVLLLLAALIIVSVSGCGKSKAERELERARETAYQLDQAYQSAKKEYDDLNRAIDRYNDAVAKVNGN